MSDSEEQGKENSQASEHQPPVSEDSNGSKQPTDEAPHSKNEQISEAEQKPLNTETQDLDNNKALELEEDKQGNEDSNEQVSSQVQPSDTIQHKEQDPTASEEPIVANSKSHQQDASKTEQSNNTESERRRSLADQDSKDTSPAETLRRSSAGQQQSINGNPFRTQSVFKVFEEAVAQRKRKSFEKFRTWEEYRAARINGYRSIIESLIQSLIEKASMSYDDIESLLKFFTERKNQEELHHTTMSKNLPHIGSLFQDKTLSSSGRWMLPSVLQEYDKLHVHQGEISRQLAEFIQKHVLRDNLAETQKTYGKFLVGFRDHIEKTRARVDLINERTAKKTNKYASLFTQLVKESVPQKSGKQKDLHNKELSIVASAQLQVETHKAFGTETLDFWEHIQKLEKQRFVCIKTVLTSYLAKLKELYGEAYCKADTLQKLLTNYDPEKQVDTLLQPASLLTAKQTAYIKKMVGNEEEKTSYALMFADVKSFVEGLEHELPPVKPLVLKEWAALKETGSLKSFKPCEILITVDGNILLIDKSDEKIFKKADHVLKLSLVTLENDSKKKNPLVIEVTETKPGFFLNSKTKHILKFHSIEQVEEFHQYFINYKH